MASKGKCKRCGKTVYELECMSAGPPGNIDVYHRWCFKCQNEGCTWQLDRRNYTYMDGHIYCKNHCPMKGFSNTKHAKGTFSVDSVEVKAAVSAPRLPKTNEQVRGTHAGEATSVGLDSMSIAKAREAPKLDTAKSQVLVANFCSNCGCKSSGGSFCTECGAKLLSYNAF
jgi:hypothetical protein